MYKTKNHGIILVACILIILTICGSFFDLEISKTLYRGQQPIDNIFGIVFAFIGIIPTFVGWSFLGASIICLSKNVSNLKKRRMLVALAVLLFILSFFFFCNTIMMVNNNAFSVHWAIAYPIAIFLFPALCEYVPKLKKHKTLLFIIGFIWWALMAFSRLTVGAHYLSDVTIAGLITLLSYQIVKFIWLAISRHKIKE